MHKIALVLAIAAVGEGLLALHLVSQLHKERESAQALQARVIELERRAPQPAAVAAFPAVPTQPAAAKFTIVTPSAPAPSQEPAHQQEPALPTEPEAAEMRKQMVESFERQRALLRDPEYREAMVAQQKMMLMRMNPEIARDLELTPEQMDRLYTTMGEQYVRRMETQEYPWDGTADPEQVQRKMEEANRKSGEQQQADLAEIRKVLGDAKFREFEQYQAMVTARGEAAHIRESLATAGVPLDANLAMPLARVLDEHQRKSLRAAEAAAPADGFVAHAGFISDPESLITVMNSVVSQQQQLESIEKYQRQQREALARVLSPQQLKVIEEEQESSLQLQRAQLRIMQTQPETASSN
ncbi:MAG TPA: hypothetical protein VJ303_09375 [Steroidobacteraceae bacterium]|jgi:hypothetical protein|nr:hypothetical protein [Steroidobacteraceae bacterium]